MREAFYADGIRFTCTRCSSCCRFYPGYVFLSELDLKNVTRRMGLTVEQFVSTYCRWISVPDGYEQLCLKEKENFDCIFWNSGCTIYDIRPVQCSSYPFWDYLLSDKDIWDANARQCPGINSGEYYDMAAIKLKLQQRKITPIVSRPCDK